MNPRRSQKRIRPQLDSVGRFMNASCIGNLLTTYVHTHTYLVHSEKVSASRFAMPGLPFYHHLSIIIISIMTGHHSLMANMFTAGVTNKLKTSKDWVSHVKPSLPNRVGSKSQRFVLNMKVLIILIWWADIYFPNIYAWKEKCKMIPAC